MKFILFILLTLTAMVFSESNKRTIEIEGKESIEVIDLADGLSIYEVSPRKFLKYKINVIPVKGFWMIKEEKDTVKINPPDSPETTIYWFGYVFKHLKYWNAYRNDTVVVIVENSKLGNCIDDVIYSWKIITQACYNDCDNYKQQADIIEQRSGQTINQICLDKLVETLSKMTSGISLLNMINITLITEKKSHDIYLEDKVYTGDLLESVDKGWTNGTCKNIIEKND
jgi:hypothetical protein